MQIVDCSKQRHAQAILDIFNHAILNSTALYDYKPREATSMVGWFDTKSRNNFPVIGIEDDDGKLLGFASYGTFRAWPAYKYTVEHSIYVDHECRGVGLGKILLNALINEAIERDVHTMVGGIDLTNQASIALHEQLGFRQVGIIKEAAYKFRRWLDLAFYQRILATPLEPNEE
ncbi:N-acetyltransferase family protein [Pseudomonas luteola]|uniref:GNAT family N-acetyltransferase n=1 Tax=Pseudomonas luteola TaxID=47886 RepID=UPI001EF4A4B5|nr:GNAT family N-acetyltransferase [Pseudomonas luteola]MCG7374096.1 N-acetyltransferase family protein [Pseudomonas luteola]